MRPVFDQSAMFATAKSAPTVLGPLENTRLRPGSVLAAGTMAEVLNIDPGSSGRNKGKALKAICLHRPVQGVHEHEYEEGHFCKKAKHAQNSCFTRVNKKKRRFKKKVLKQR